MTLKCHILINYNPISWHKYARSFELFIIQYSILNSMFVIIMTHHHITMLYCDFNVSFHQCIKSHHNIQVPYPNIQMSYPDIKMA